MTFIEPNIYQADEGKTFMRRVDQFIMGDRLYLFNFIDGSRDVIENYTEIDDPDYEEEEYEG
jgi:hypothetical protein